MNAADRTSSPQGAVSNDDDVRRLAVSALVDGELSSAELETLFDGAISQSDWTAEWKLYHLIGDVLRGSQPAVALRAPSSAFAAAVTKRLSQDVEPSLPDASMTVAVRGMAANDAVFRWKLVAGLASLAAVAAVGWSVVGLDGTQAPQGPQIAVAPPAAQVTPLAVVVQTPQGDVLRDPRLEQLLAEHRQYGGMSALQTPTGFLRNATYDSAPQR